LKGQVELAGEIANEGFIPIRFFASNAVVHVDDGEDDAELVAFFEKRSEQGDGIRPA
jgi:hypothetical protein